VVDWIEYNIPFEAELRFSYCFMISVIFFSYLMSSVFCLGSLVGCIACWLARLLTGSDAGYEIEMKMEEKGDEEK
jgi:hypothetical protein